MVLTGGEFNWTGGEVNNDLYGRNTRWDVATTVSDTARLIARGSESRLGNNVSRNVTLWVQGGNDIGHATLTADAGLVNHGTIVLESINSNWQSNLTVSGGELQNAFDGVIQVNTGTGGGRNLTGSVTNEGTINVGTGFEVGGKPDLQHGVRCDQRDRRLHGAHRRRIQLDRRGSQQRPVRAEHCWDVATTVSDTARLIARGSESRLGNNVSRNVTLWVQGGNDIGHATLTADAGLVYHGTIVLESINSNWQSNLTVSGGELQNAFDGVIQVNTGTGGGGT